METVVKVMLSIFIVGLVVMTIVFFSIFGLLPAEKLTEVFRGETSTSSPTVIISTTTVVERIIERTVEESDSSNGESNQEQQEPDQEPQNDIDQTDDQSDEPSEPTGPTTQSLPPAVFNTSGEVTAIQGNTVFVASDGSHMETIPSNGVVPVEIIVTDSTNLLDNENNEITLSAISVGDNISVESSENIKNETQFEASNLKLSD